MLSTRFRCIFVRISKVASTSIQAAFTTPRNPWEALKIRFLERGEFHVKHHDIQHYQKAYPDTFDSYFKFSFVRNPWDRMHSQYRYQRFNLNRETAQCSFDDWLKKCKDSLDDPNGFLFGRNRHNFLLHIGNQTDWLKIDGQLRVDFIGRYESLQEDFDRMCSQQKWQVRLPKLNETKSKRETYVSQYTNWSSELISQWCADDIREFGYSFGA